MQSLNDKNYVPMGPLIVVLAIALITTGIYFVGTLNTILILIALPIVLHWMGLVKEAISPSQRIDPYEGVPGDIPGQGVIPPTPEELLEMQKGSNED